MKNESDSMKELGKKQVHEPIVDAEKSSDIVPVTHPAIAASPPPDGGLTAWLQVLGSWMMIFNTWGTPLSHLSGPRSTRN